MNTPASEAPADPGLYAVKPEFVLLIAGALLTLLVLGFVLMLVRSIVKEQREEARRKQQEQADG